MTKIPGEILVKLSVADIMNPDNNHGEGWDPRLILAAAESPTGRILLSLENLLAVSMMPGAVEIVLKRIKENK